MKKILLLITAVMLLTAEGYSQAPGILNYQGVARNSVGNVLVNQNITLRLTIRNNTAAGPTVYQESRAVTTNPFGLFNVQVGSPGASGVSGTVTGVNWAVGAKFLQVEINPNGGSTFINIGTAQLASVPYSLFAAAAGDFILPFNKTQNDNGTLFKITNSGTNSGSTALEGLTNSTAGSANALIGTVTSAAPGGFSAGVRGINNGTGGNGIGVYGSQAGSGWGVYGTTPSGIGVNGNSSSGTGVYGSSNTGVAGIFTISNSASTADALQANTSGTGWAATITSSNATPSALRTTGGLRFTGINEANNRILTSDASGNATWKDAAAVGIVTGSGILNYVSKWTPDGATLGNSQIFDDGNNVGVGTITPSERMHVYGGRLLVQNNNPITVLPAATWVDEDVRINSGDAQLALYSLQDGLSSGAISFKEVDGTGALTNQWAFQRRTDGSFDIGFGIGADPGAATSVIKALSNGNIGIGITTPTERLNVNGRILVDNSPITVLPAAMWSDEDIRINSVDAQLSLYSLQNGVGSGAISLKEVDGTGNLTNQWALKRQTDGSFDIGYGTGANPGVVGSVIRTLSNGNVGIGTTAPTAKLDVAGAFKLADGTEGAGKVLTSDAAGNASWQDFIIPAIHMSAASTTAFVTVPPSTQTNITTQWGALDEAGGANYNPATGEYTIPVTGYYSVFLHLEWNDPAPSSGADLIFGQITVNGTGVARSYSSTSIAGNIPAAAHAQVERNFNAGDIIRFSANQNTSGPMNLVQNSNACKFGIHLIHR